MKNKVFVFAVVVTLIGALFVGCTPGEPQGAVSEGKQVVLRMAHTQTADSFYGEVCSLWAKLVDERSNGRVKIEIYEAGQLGQERDYLEQEKTGALDLAVIAAAPVSTMTSALRFTDTFYAVQSMDHVKAILQSEMLSKLLVTLEDHGLIGFNLAGGGWRVLNTSEKVAPVACLEDMGGLKIRCMESPEYIYGFKALGANPVAMPFGEAYTALSQGTVEAIDCPLWVIDSYKFYEVTPNCTNIKAVMGFCIFVGSKKTLEQKLAPEDLEMLYETNMEVCIYACDRAVEIENQATESLLSKGQQFYEIDYDLWKNTVIASPDVQAEKDKLNNEWAEYLGYNMYDEIDRLASGD